MQHALLKQSTPELYAQYIGQAARHINSVGDYHFIAVNSDHQVDVYKRGEARKIKTLEINFMRYSLVVGGLLFIGTEEKMIYMVETKSFEIVDRVET